MASEEPIQLVKTFKEAVIRTRKVYPLLETAERDQLVDLHLIAVNTAALLAMHNEPATFHPPMAELCLRNIYALMSKRPPKQGLPKEPVGVPDAVEITVPGPNSLTPAFLGILGATTEMEFVEKVNESIHKLNTARQEQKSAPRHKK